jgi:hypothetical protein
MGDTAPVLRLGDRTAGRSSAVGKRIPQPELGAQAAVASCVTRPVTSACALITFQSGKRGGWSGLEIFSMKACLEIGANRPERCRSAAITPADLRAEAVMDRRSVIAIGSGSTLPLLMLISTWARAGVSGPAADVDPAMPVSNAAAAV